MQREVKTMKTPTSTTEFEPRNTPAPSDPKGQQRSKLPLLTWGWKGLSRFLLTQSTHALITLVLIGLLMRSTTLVDALKSTLSLGQQAPAAPTEYGEESFTFHYQGRLADASGAPIHNISPGVNITFSLYISDTATTPLWREPHPNVPVANGLFSVLLGSIHPLTTTVHPESDMWLGIQVEQDPEMTPRQLLGGEALHAWHAGEADVARNLEVEGAYMMGDRYGRPAHINYPDIYAGWPYTHEVQAYLNNVTARVAAVEGATMFNGVIGVASGTFTDAFELQLMVEAHDRVWSSPGLDGYESRVYIGGHEHPEWDVNGPPDYQPGGLTVYANGDATLDGTLTTGAIVERNLLSPDEQTEHPSERFSKGDVLCWHYEALALCDQPNDASIVAVADKNGHPIVLGAEPINVLGPVQEGDFLVASHIPGYARVNNTPSIGTVIAQALENFDGEQGRIQAMIRKF